MNDFVILADGNPIATSDIASEMSDLFTSGTHDGFHGPFAEAHAAGARFFIMVDDSDSEMRVVRLDENMRPDMTTLHAAADAEIAEYDGLRLSSPDQDYDSWLDDTGLDPSAYGGFGVPGSIEKYLAAQRFALCEQAGIGTSSPLPSL